MNSKEVIKDLAIKLAKFPYSEGDIVVILNGLVAEAIAEHDKAIIDDIDFGYSADMIKGKLINKSYEPFAKR